METESHGKPEQPLVKHTGGKLTEYEFDSNSIRELVLNWLRSWNCLRKSEIAKYVNNCNPLEFSSFPKKLVPEGILTLISSDSLQLCLLKSRISFSKFVFKNKKIKTSR